MCLQPEVAGCGARINASFSPPIHFITAAMHLAVMSPAQRNGELVTDFAAQRR
jgi:hypothetical protein